MAEKKAKKKTPAKKVAKKATAPASAKAPARRGRKAAAKKAAKPAVGQLEATVYGVDGTQAGSVKLPEAVFGAEWKADLVHQVVTAFQANARTNTAFAKDRSEVRGGGRKPWRQKGTGRARHGSRRSPIWRSGGATHAPTKERDFSKKVSKKMRAAALMSTLSQKLRDGEVLFVDSLGMSEPKASGARAALDALASVKGHEVLGSKKTNIALIATAEKDENVQRSFSNFSNVEVEEVRNLNALDVMTYKHLIVVDPDAAVSFLSSKVHKAGKN